jgi:hypothetical protein
VKEDNLSAGYLPVGPENGGNGIGIGIGSGRIEESIKLE